MDRLSKTSQKRITNVNDFLLKTFKTTTELNSSLKRERILPKNQYLEVGRKTLEALNSLSTVKKTRPVGKANDQQYLMVAEVKGLEHYKRAEPNEKIAKMLRQQKDGRRERHFSLLTEYERLRDALYKDVQREYETVRGDVEVFFKNDNAEMRAYVNKFTDAALLEQDHSFVSELHGFVMGRQDLRGEKIIGLLGRLTDVEYRREESMGQLIEGLKDSLIDNAYYLQNQVEELTREEEANYEEVSIQQKEENETYIDRFNEQQRIAFEEFQVLATNLEKRWRRLHHEATLVFFRTEMEKEEYVNPQERNFVYQSLKEDQVEVYSKRRDVFRQMVVIHPESIKKALAEKTLDSVREISESAQSKYDKRFEELLAQHNSLEVNLHGVKEDIREKLLGFNADLDEGVTLESIIEGEIQDRVNEILTQDKETLSKAIACIEDNDLKANELLTNLLGFYVKIGTMQDAVNLNSKKFKFNYDLDKAKLADENDEKTENLNGELEVKKKNIKESVHHPQLEECLKEGFAQLDDIEAEIREFHERNLTLVQKHPFSISEFFAAIDKDLAAKFELVDESRRAEIQAKYQKEAEDSITQMIEAEEKRKEEDEQRAAQEQGGKKGAKPPAKKDPKKQQKEMEERRAQLLAEVPPRTVQTYESPFGTKWLHLVTLEEFAREFLCIKFDEGQAKKGTASSRNDRLGSRKDESRAVVDQKQTEAAPQNEQTSNDQEKNKYFTEWQASAPRDLHGNLLLSEDVVFTFQEIKELSQNLMQQLFENACRRKIDSLADAEVEDKDFIETSMILLDQRLKAHYPAKGRLETEVYQLRSSEITEHKKRYERHARITGEKLDNQTEEFNMLLEDAVESLKTFEQEQKDLRAALTSAETISRMDGIQTQAKDKSAKFGENSLDIENHLSLLAKDETNRLLQANRDFIKNLQLFENGGNFSTEEVTWYDNMLKELDEKIKVEAEAREQRLQEIKELLANRKQAIVAQFEAEYVVALEELCAKDGTGKKYGKPKRIAQERLRTEMNKCERAQEAINNIIESLEKQHTAFQKAVSEEDEEFFVGNPSFSVNVRKNLMAVRSCIARYAIHVDAIKKDCPVEAMPRITFNEERLGIAVTASEVEEDKVTKEAELELLGPLYYQKENRKFSEWIQDIENNIKIEAQKLYIDKNTKFLTGTDKIPDYLRTYFEGTKRQMEEFRNSCCRNLRESCLKLAEMADNINAMVFNSVNQRYLITSRRENGNRRREFDILLRETERLKECHTKELRPNLANPACKEEFDKLNEKEAVRLEKFLKEVESCKQDLSEFTETTSNKFFKALINNFEFLILYYDRLYLFEDFNKVTGDEDIQKKRATLKTLLKTKLTGVIVDRTTERCIEKKWAGFPMDAFMILKGKPLPYDEDELALPAESESAQKSQAAGGPKGKQPKKEEKKPKEVAKKPEAGAEIKEEGGVVENTRDVPSFKTPKHKNCYQTRNKIYEGFKNYFERNIQEIISRFDGLKEQELKYQFQWERSIDQIFNQS